MTRTTSRLLRSLLAALVAAASLVTLVGTAAPAGATTTDTGTTYLIAWGNAETVIEGAAPPSPGSPTASTTSSP